MNSINHKKGLKISRKIFSKKRKERTEKELGRFLIQSSLSSSDDFGVQKSNVNTLAYRLALPAELAQIHNVFHVSMLRRYRTDPIHVISEPTIEVAENLTYAEEPVTLLESGMK